jgi:hypothetical protein
VIEPKLTRRGGGLRPALGVSALRETRQGFQDLWPGPFPLARTLHAQFVHGLGSPTDRALDSSRSGSDRRLSGEALCVGDPLRRSRHEQQGCSSEDRARSGTPPAVTCSLRPGSADAKPQNFWRIRVGSPAFALQTDGGPPAERTVDCPPPSNGLHAT